MWTWNDSEVMTAEARERMVNFAVGRNITSLYVQAEYLMGAYPDRLAALINLAASRNITVELLFADHNWLFTANHQYVVNLVQRANAYVAGLTGAKPVGYHFDVEPHIMAGWETNKVSYGNQLIDLYAKVMAVRAPQIKVNIDMALGHRDVLLTRSGVTKSLSHWLVDTTDRTTIMSYRDFALGANSVTYHADHPVAYAAQVGKQTYVGLETQCNIEPEIITFCEEGHAALGTELAKIYQYYGSAAGFGGVVLHDYAAYSIAPYAAR